MILCVLLMIPCVLLIKLCTADDTVCTADDTVCTVDGTATRGVTVSTSAFLACHQCYCAGSSLAWGLNLRAVVCGIF